MPPPSSSNIGAAFRHGLVVAVFHGSVLLVFAPIPQIKQLLGFFFQDGHPVHHRNVIDAHTTPPMATIITPAARRMTLSMRFNRALICA